MKHIFVALGQHHVNNFENIIKNNLIGTGETILMAGPDVVIDHERWDEMVISKKSFNNKAPSVLFQVFSINAKIRTYRNLIKRIAHLKNEQVTVYICYIEDVLSNYMFFSFSKDIKAVIIEDGTLNYYNHTLRNIDKKKFLLKQLFAAVNGVSFKNYKGHSSGAEYAHVKAQYLTFPESSIIKTNAKQLPIEKEILQELSNSLFIIGQEAYGNLIGQNQFETALHSFMNRLRTQPFYKEITTVYYKPHRNGKQLLENIFSESFPEKNVKVIHTSKTSEELYFEDIKAKYIACFDSSTLINIYSKLEDKDRNTIHFYVNPLKNDELIPLFKNLKFTFLNTNSQ